MLGCEWWWFDGLSEIEVHAKMKQRVGIPIGLFVAGIAVVCVAQADPIDDLQPGQWYEFPNSKMSAKDPCPTNDCAYSGTTHQPSVMDAWAGGAYDTSRDRLMVWGGGHGDYGGNEVYAFDVNAGTWSRLTEPSVPKACTPTDPADIYPDGRPSATHTYDHLEYLPTLDAFVTFGIGNFGTCGIGGAPNTFALDLKTNQWSQLAARPDQTDEKEYGEFTALDGKGNIWAHTNEGGARFHSYNIATNKWTTYGSAATYYGSQGATAAVDTKRNRLIAIGDSGGGYANGLIARAWDLNNPNNASTAIGNVPVSLASPGGPGVDYDPVDDRFLIWNGGTTVYTLNAADLSTWGTLTLYSGNTVTPTPPNSRGTYGRFRYVPSKQAVIVVNSTSENVYLFKLRDGSFALPTVVLDASPSATVSFKGSITLTWTTTNASSCTANGAWSGTKGTAGSETISNVVSTQTYRLDCVGPGGNAGQQIKVTVLDESTPVAAKGTSGAGALSLVGLGFLVAGAFVARRHRRLRAEIGQSHGAH